MRQTEEPGKSTGELAKGIILWLANLKIRTAKEVARVYIDNRSAQRK